MVKVGGSQRHEVVKSFIDRLFNSDLVRPFDSRDSHFDVLDENSKNSIIKKRASSIHESAEAKRPCPVFDKPPTNEQGQHQASGAPRKTTVKSERHHPRSGLPSVSVDDK